MVESIQRKRQAEDSSVSFGSVGFEIALRSAVVDDSALPIFVARVRRQGAALGLQRLCASSPTSGLPACYF